ERPVEAERDELSPDEGERVADVVPGPMRVTRRVTGRRRAVGLAVAERRREGHLEPEHRPQHEEEEERRPAEVDAREAAVGGPEAPAPPTQRPKHAARRRPRQPT